MPGRKLNRVVPTEDLMGEGTFVKYIEPTSADMDEYRFKMIEVQSLIQDMEKNQTIDIQKIRDLRDNLNNAQADFLAKHIIEWNWVVDEAGVIPMAQPNGNPDVFLNELRESERQYLNNLFQVTPEKKDK